MLFVDFNELKIIKEFNYNTEEYTLACSPDASVLTLSTQINALLQSVVKHEPIAVHYIIHFDDTTTATEEEDEEMFLTIVNTTLAGFFRLMTTTEPRKRDYRLDVAEKLKGVHASYSLLKRAINNHTVNDVFNLTITYKNLIFYLCDEKDFKDNKEFIHTIDELENK